MPDLRSETRPRVFSEPTEVQNPELRTYRTASNAPRAMGSGKEQQFTLAADVQSLRFPLITFSECWLATCSHFTPWCGVLIEHRRFRQFHDEGLTGLYIIFVLLFRYKNPAVTLVLYNAQVSTALPLKISTCPSSPSSSLPFRKWVFLIVELSQQCNWHSMCLSCSSLCSSYYDMDSSAHQAGFSSSFSPLVSSCVESWSIRRSKSGPQFALLAPF